MVMEASERRTFQFFQLKLCKRGNLFCRNGIQMENGLDLGAEVPRINFFVAPLPRDFMQQNFIYLPALTNYFERVSSSDECTLLKSL